MRVLLDECLPRKLTRELQGHFVRTVQDAGWAGKKNGELLRLAEREFDCFITVDQNMRYQQTLGTYQLAIVVLVAQNSRFETLMPLMGQVRELLPEISVPTLIRVATAVENSWSRVIERIGRTMTITWREVALPDFGPLGDRPEIPATIYAARCDRAYAAAGADWLIVYGDREHYANLTYLTGYDPRFEEGILLLGAVGRRILLVGNEGLDYAGLLTLPLDIVLCQSLSLPGQDRGKAPRLGDVLREAGIAVGQSLALVGWKGIEAEEWSGRFPTFFAPSLLVDTLRDLAGDPAALRDATPVLLHPIDGLRATNEIEQIVAFEWAAARATAAVRRIQVGTRPGMTELEAVGQMGYEGDPLSTHVLFASSTGPIVGLGSAGSRRIARGDGITTGFGYWGGLCARAGMVDDQNQEFLDRLAVPYFRGLVAWYETVGVGVAGGTVFDRVTSVLAEGGLRSALNPGHLTGHDEWVHSPMVPGGTGTLRSGMAFQCDVIPTPAPAGWALNCEDPVIFADADLRADLAARYPAVWSRIAARQRFMREGLGIAIGDDVLPLSTIPAYLAPLWLAPNTVLVQG